MSQDSTTRRIGDLISQGGLLCVFGVVVLGTEAPKFVIGSNTISLFVLYQIYAGVAFLVALLFLLAIRIGVVASYLESVFDHPISVFQRLCFVLYWFAFLVVLISGFVGNISDVPINEYLRLGILMFGMIWMFTVGYMLVRPSFPSRSDGVTIRMPSQQGSSESRTQRSEREGMVEGGSMSGDRIRDLDQWFQFAEKIGQERLTNFLWSASILLLACATIISSDTVSNLLANFLSVLGIIMSLLWIILGRRQAKFHGKIDYELRQAFREHKEPEQFAIYHIQQMKDYRDGQPRDVRLNQIELALSNRRFLWFVPVLFALAFVATLAVGIVS